MAEKKSPTEDTLPVANDAPKTEKRRWAYIGPKYQNGVYLPDATTLVQAATCPDPDIDAYVARFPNLEGELWRRN